MNKEIKAYLRLEAAVAAAFNFFINGMIAALIYHKADWVPADTVSLAIDLTLTCFLISAISVPFCRASLRRTKTEGIRETKNPLLRRLGCMARRPALFGASLGLTTVSVLFALIAPVFALLKISTIPFAGYVVLKPLLGALLGALVTLTALYAGMLRPHNR